MIYGMESDWAADSLLTKHGPGYDDGTKFRSSIFHLPPVSCTGLLALLLAGSMEFSRHFSGPLYFGRTPP
jgi:hypothetical protein